MNQTKVMAVASGGGHWVQLMRMRPAFEDCRVVYVTTEPGYADTVGPGRFYVVMNASRWNKLRLVGLLIQVAWLLVKERPDVVISTGAAPGYFALRLAKLVGARTVWVDSIANAEEMSLAGRKIMRHVDLCLTQWEHLAAEDGPRYAGAVV